MKHIDKEDLYELCCNSYYRFMNEIKVNHKTTQIWNTMLNTVIKHDNNMKGAVRLLHQTNVQRTN